MGIFKKKRFWIPLIALFVLLMLVVVLLILSRDDALEDDSDLRPPPRVECDPEVNGVTVRRFPVARERDIERFDPVANKVCFSEHTDEEERRWAEEHGPVSR